jgi:hypothetical protein
MSNSIELSGIFTGGDDLVCANCGWESYEGYYSPNCPVCNDILEENNEKTK